MKTVTISKQWQYLLDGRLADTTMCRTFKRRGVKNSPGEAGWLRGKPGDVPPSEKYAARISSRPSVSMKHSAGKKRELESLITTTINGANIEQTQNFLAAFRGLSPV